MDRAGRTLGASLLVCIVSFGCETSDPPSQASTEPVRAVSASSLPESAAVAAVASSAPTTARPAPRVVASSAEGGRRAPGGPPFPLQAWMKSTMGPALNAGDFATVAAALDQLAAEAPPAYSNWRSIAKDGADAARVEDADAVKAACRTCHEQYKARYRNELRDRPL